MRGQEHEPTHETRALVTLRKRRGCTDAQVAEYMGLSENTLRKHYHLELRIAKEDFTDSVFGRLASLIESNNEMVAFNAQKFYLTHQAGWKSADKQIEVDALKENTAALERKRLLDEKTEELRQAQDK